MLTTTPSRAGAAPATRVPAIVGEVLRSPGAPLDAGTREAMGAAFGFDFGRVRVHTDARADHLELGAPGDRHERQADAAAARVASGGPAPRLTSLPSRPRVQRQGPTGQGPTEQGPAPPAVGMGDVKVAEALLAEVDRILAGVDYQVGAGETIASVAKRFGTTVEALQRANELPTTVLQAGQRLKVPAPAGCTLTVPSSMEAQILAGAIFAEASPKAEANDEREAIAWAFVNSARHVQRLCAGELECPGASEARMRDQCEIDRKSLGSTITESVQRGSVAYNGPRWKLVMTGDVLLPAGNLCLLPQSEVPAITRAIEAAEAVLGGSATERDYLRFNRAANSPPNPKRMEKAGQHEGHTFYRFKPGAECG